MEDKELRELFRETAGASGGANSEADKAYKEFCAALTTPILDEVRMQSIARQLFAVERLGPGAQASYPVADDFEVPVFVLPGLGRVPENFIEGVGEEVNIHAS